MSNKSNPDDRHVPADLNAHDAKLRDLSDRLRAIGERLGKQAPGPLEMVLRRLEEELGPKVLKEIFDRIPNTAAKQDASSNSSSIQAHKESDHK